MILPACLVEFFGRTEDRYGTAFVAVAAFVIAFAGAERFCRLGDFGYRLKQGRLVALDLNNQCDVGLFGDLEVFF
jgi:hypothetical protein